MPGKIVIQARNKKGYCRCNMRHPATEQTYPEDKFTPEQLHKLTTDPNLMVKLVDMTLPPAPENKKADKPKGKSAAEYIAEAKARKARAD